MTVRRVFAAFCLSLLADSGWALSFEACTKAERARLDSAVVGAAEMTRAAAAAVRDDALYRTWFGQYAPRRADEVRARFKAVHAALLLDALDFVCINDGFESCKSGTFAYVYRDAPYRIHVCVPFHRLPAMLEADPSEPEMENGTREGTIIHEMSHFAVVAGTEDTCYARSACRDLAALDPVSVILNADSLQYFAEDVGFLLGAPGQPLVKTGRSRR